MGVHLLVFLNSCVDRKSSDLGLGGIRREYLQTDCAINAVRCSLLFSWSTCIGNLCSSRNSLMIVCSYTLNQFAPCLSALLA